LESVQARGLTAAATALGKQAFTLSALASQLTGPADRLGLLARFFLGRLLVMVTALHFAESAFPLHFLFQCLERLLDIVIAHDDLNDGVLSLDPQSQRRKPLKKHMTGEDQTGLSIGLAPGRFQRKAGEIPEL
jgi:hypothetical protein